MNIQFNEATTVYIKVGIITEQVPVSILAKCLAKYQYLFLNKVLLIQRYFAI